MIRSSCVIAISVAASLIANTAASAVSSHQAAVVPNEITILDVPACPACEILFEQVHVLGDSDGPGILQREPTIATLDHAGNFLVAERSRFLVFGSDGQYVASVGRPGQGPGEFQRIVALKPHEDGRIDVFDAVAMRLTSLSPEYEVVDTVALEIMPTPRILLLPSDEYLLYSDVRTADRIGVPLHVVTRGGEVRASFGSSDGGRLLPQRFSGRKVARAWPRGIWSAHTYEYAIELWTMEGSLRLSLRREADWFPPIQFEDEVESPKPITTIQSVREDNSGLLWVLSAVADEDWESYLETGADGFPRLVGSNAQLFDTVVEVIDPDEGQLIARRRVDEFLSGFLSDGVVGGGIADEADLFFGVWEMELLSRPERGASTRVP